MKKCLQCEQVYGDETNFCLSDGSTLVAVAGSAASPGETPTVFSGASRPSGFPAGTTDQPPLIYADPPLGPPKKSRALPIALAVGVLALVIGGAVVGLAAYWLVNQKNVNVPNVSNSNGSANKDAVAEQKNGNDNLAQNLKEQQEKIDKDKKKLEDERKALEAKKKESPSPSPLPSHSPPQPPAARTATIIDPPTNIRLSPNGTILCVVRQRTSVNILGPTGVTDGNGSWYYTDACGRQGVIHSSQIRF